MKTLSLVVVVFASSGNRSLPLPIRRVVCETKSKKGAPETENPSCIGFRVLRGGLRPWSQTMSRKGPDHGVGVDLSLLTNKSFERKQKGGFVNRRMCPRSGFFVPSFRFWESIIPFFAP